MPSLTSLKKLAPYALPVGAQIAGGLVNRRGAGRATRSLTSGANTAIAGIRQAGTETQKLLSQIHGQQQATLNPYAQAGVPALQKLQGGAGAQPFERNPEFTRPTDFTFSAGELEKDPGYQFRLAEGNKLLARRQASSGSLSSGAALKAALRYSQDAASQEYGTAYSRAEGTFGANYGRANEQFGENYQRAEGTFRANQNAEMQALLEQIGIGERGAAGQVNASANFGEQSVRNTQLTAQQIAELETQKANAEAEGNVEGANAINGILSGVQSAVSGVQDMNTLKGLLRPAVTAGAGIAATAGGAASAALPTTLGALAPGVASITGAGAAPTIVAPALAGGTGGLGASAAAFATNPITLAVAAGIGGALLAKKFVGQGRKAADVLTNPGGIQRAFNETLSEIDGMGLPPEQAWTHKVEAYSELIKTAKAHAAKGKNPQKVVQQMLNQVSPYFGQAAPVI